MTFSSHRHLLMTLFLIILHPCSSPLSHVAPSSCTIHAQALRQPSQNHTAHFQIPTAHFVFPKHTILGPGNCCKSNGRSWWPLNKCTYLQTLTNYRSVMSNLANYDTSAMWWGNLGTILKTAWWQGLCRGLEVVVGHECAGLTTPRRACCCFGSNVGCRYRAREFTLALAQVLLL